MFKAFKYIKTFSPLRRFTTSAAATLRWQIEKRNLLNTGSEERGVATDLALDRSLNRSFMIDPEDRLYQDSILVERNAKARKSTRLNPDRGFLPMT